MQRSPLSEQCQGVLTVLSRLGLADFARARDLVCATASVTLGPPQRQNPRAWLMRGAQRAVASPPATRAVACGTGQDPRVVRRTGPDRVHGKGVGARRPAVPHSLPPALLSPRPLDTAMPRCGATRLLGMNEVIDSMMSIADARALACLRMVLPADTS